MYKVVKKRGRVKVEEYGEINGFVTKSKKGKITIVDNKLDCNIGNDIRPLIHRWGKSATFFLFRFRNIDFIGINLDILPAIARELVGYIHIENMGLAAGIGNDQRENLLLARFRIHTEGIELGHEDTAPVETLDIEEH